MCSRRENRERVLKGKRLVFTGKICTRNKLAWQINLWRVAQWLHVDRVFPSYWHLQDRIETSQDGQGSAHERFKIFAPSHFGKAQACGSWKRRWTNTVRHHPRGGKGEGLVAWPRQSRRHNSSTGWVLTAGEKVWHLAKGQVQADWWHERKSPEWLLYDLWQGRPPCHGPCLVEFMHCNKVLLVPWIDVF